MNKKLRLTLLIVLTVCSLAGYLGYFKLMEMQTKREDQQEEKRLVQAFPIVTKSHWVGNPKEDYQQTLDQLRNVKMTKKTEKIFRQLLKTNYVYDFYSKLIYQATIWSEENGEEKREFILDKEQHFYIVSTTNQSENLREDYQKGKTRLLNRTTKKYWEQLNKPSQRQMRAAFYDGYLTGKMVLIPEEFQLVWAATVAGRSRMTQNADSSNRTIVGQFSQQESTYYANCFYTLVVEEQTGLIRQLSIQRAEAKVFGLDGVSRSQVPEYRMDDIAKDRTYTKVSQRKIVTSTTKVVE